MIINITQMYSSFSPSDFGLAKNLSEHSPKRIPFQIPSVMEKGVEYHYFVHVLWDSNGKAPILLPHCIFYGYDMTQNNYLNKMCLVHFKDQ